MSNNHSASVVIDNGSGCCKAGIAGDDAPRSHFPNVVGIPKTLNVKIGLEENDIFVGNQVDDKQGVLQLHKPIQQGLITDWDNMEKIWHNVYYNELKMVPEDHPCLMTEVPLNSRKNKEKMAEIIFDTFNVPAYYAGVSSVLSLYSSGRMTGLVIDSGDGLTASVPIFEGYVLPHAIQKIDFAGQDLNRFLLKLLQESGNEIQKSYEQFIVQDIKEKLCFIALDFAEEEKIYAETSSLDKIYQLPDGQNINLSQQRFVCPESLFQPKLLGKDSLGIHESVFTSLMKIDTDCLKEIYTNIVLSGGSTKFPGLIERLTKELNILAPSSIKTKVFGPPERVFAAWIGGSILASLNTFQQMWINKSEYEEYGSSIVNRKFN